MAERQPLIRLSLAEIARCHRIIEQRQAVKKQFKVQTQKMDKHHNDLEIDFIGIKGEVAAAKFLGCHVDESATPEGDDGSDLMWQGVRVQMKTAMTLHKPHLIIRHSGYLTSDLYILGITTLEHNAVRLMGWLDKHTLLDKAFIRDFGAGERMAVASADLYGMDAITPHPDQDLVWDSIASHNSPLVMDADRQMIWQERSAIMENDGQMSRARADLEAYKSLKREAQKRWAN